MELETLEIFDKCEIDDYTFYLIKKKLFARKSVVNIISVHNATNMRHNFWVYASSSELGCWRFCSTKEYPRFYKGDTHGANFDYVQGTIIHIN